MSILEKSNYFNLSPSPNKLILVMLFPQAWIHDTPNNLPDGSLNPCLQCDEDESGPNFMYFSGRTRRNSGIPSSIERPPEQFYSMEHCYWYGDLDDAAGQRDTNNL